MNGMILTMQLKHTPMNKYANQALSASKATKTETVCLQQTLLPKRVKIEGPTIRSKEPGGIFVIIPD
jgi:hypothetical protein